MAGRVGTRGRVHEHVAAVAVVAILSAVVAGPAQGDQGLGIITEFPVPTPNSQPAGIARGSDGSLWFTEAIGDKIGRITPSGAVTEYLLAEGAAPVGIAAGPDGALWFAEMGGNRIGRITTAGVIREYPVPSSDSGPHEIAVGPDGNLWFTEIFGSRIGKISPTSKEIAEFLLPTSEAAPGYIVAGPDHAMWFHERRANQIGRIRVLGHEP